MTMSVTQIAISRLNKGAQALCTKRNVNLPVELGKCLYQPFEKGVIFYKAAYLLDSRHSEYTSPVAKILFDALHGEWLFFQAKFDGDTFYWEPYYPLMKSDDLDSILEEIEHDPLACFW
ncbi:TPA: DUF3024 domain-containing protein [Vibrio vulnificus]|uniref:DUF3024 domain-containing protein n=1 Tax=Vibrio vulnificus TaxID=672 RepID=UPI001023B5E5|nr:DUF3024 domain-containing protein [Vibrio vulnificus]MCU8131767.1 DUF3024 domain-containing protein [Vibrio vulnificus]MDT8802573.1 DUF3024 domain-containing protein [Vibrio vulnificus]RZP63670.1 DUF3024 domain-containing protein [Vibrio vulnificus]RZR17347.1 DUF3024 domain-containing protein [Vibrio vulnificus]HAS6278581.1 DUF3024 domain-containing protein [Vibrio vulnificus]